MRRADKEVIDLKIIDAVLQEALVCRLAMVNEGEPYLVPMNFAYRDNCLYFHSAPEGTKIDILRRNPRVCFEVETRVELAPSEKACNWSIRYFSVVGFGTASIVEDLEEKRRGLQYIMEKHSGRTDWQFDDRVLDTMILLRVSIEHMTGKKSRYESWVPQVRGAGEEGEESW